MTSSAHLQREASAARVGLADTLGQLREGMAPSALSGEALGILKDTGLSIVKSLTEQARGNPVPALLIGAGLTMLLTKTTGGDVMSAASSALKGAAATSADAARGVAGAAGSAMSGAARQAASATTEAAAAAGQSAGEAVSDSVSSLRQKAADGLHKAGDGISEGYATARDKVQGTFDAARDTAQGTFDAARDKAQGTYDAARDKIQGAVDEGRRTLHDGQDRLGAFADQAQDRAKSMADDTRASIAKLLEEQPILMAALGAALGAAVGAALPLSKQEKDMLAGLGASALGAGRKVASKAADVVREEVAKADLGTKVGEVADKVVTGVMGAAGADVGAKA